ncbi:hypothetical protein LOTGIDRAFT_231664 [Lottia gigantea]|uniref:Rad21/Rec8-like protein N-terminal domain-containing protein n=1 Tax=Lottia gigantea TaxID=225164 RepID=V4APZ1_LOTGI|nr:hypothetical protein LOTGIDRAFT_231664 [Lottia gigantea]ESO96830.1 hypothetical protein LOTGIDRAFT_231664 [Lottia gigantea]
MFYSLELLQKRGGQFGIIWVAATEGAKLNKRQITGVRLKKACNDIIDYIMVRGHHEYGTGKSRKRFSLYLSSQLMYGVVKIYNRQNDYLLTDATTFMARLRFASSARADIELRETANSELVTLPDPTHIADPENENFEATFGRLSNNYQESLFAHERLRFTSSSSDMDEMLSPIADINIAPFRPEDIMGSSPHTVSSLDEITLKQAPLQSHLSTMQTIDEELLFGLPDIIDHVSERLESVDVPTDQSAEARPVSPIRPHTPLQTTITEVPIIPVHETPIHRSGEDITREGRDKRKRQKSPEVTPGHKESRLERRERKRSRQQLVLDEIEMPPPVHKPRRRRRLIIDKDTQVSKEDFKKNLQNPNTCLPFVLPDFKAKTFEDYLKQPGRPLCKPLLRLYQRNCKLPRTVVLSESEYSSSTLTSSSPPTGTSVSSPTTHPETEVLCSPRHFPSSPRHPPAFELGQASELGQETSPGKSYSMERIRLDTSGNISTERAVSFSHSSIDGSLILEQSKLPETSVSRLGEVSVVIEEENLLEDHAEIPEPAAPFLESPVETEKQVSPRQFIRELRLSTANGQETTFRELVPPESTTRPIAARLFAKLLEMCKNGQVAARQERPYGDIFITQIEVF